MSLLPELSSCNTKIYLQQMICKDLRYNKAKLSTTSEEFTDMYESNTTSLTATTLHVRDPKKNRHSPPSSSDIISLNKRFSQYTLEFLSVKYSIRMTCHFITQYHPTLMYKSSPLTLPVTDSNCRPAVGILISPPPLTTWSNSNLEYYGYSACPQCLRSGGGVWLSGACTSTLLRLFQTVYISYY